MATEPPPRPASAEIPADQSTRDATLKTSDHASGEQSVAAGGLVAGGMTIMNVLVYGFTLMCTRLLTTGEYGGLGALLGLLITASVAALGFQATAARRLATAAPTQRGQQARAMTRSAVAVTAVLTLVLLLAAPAIHSLLHVSWAAALLVPVAMVPLTLLGNFTGLLQGVAAWRWLTAVFLGFGFGRIACGGVALLIHPSITSAMAGLTVGACVPLLIAWLGSRQLLRESSGESPRTAAGRPLTEVWHNAHLLLGLFTLTNLDVLLSRYLFTGHESGLYAAGAILAKACLFLPQFVIIVAFPQMARDHAEDATDRGWLKPLGLVALIGAAVVAGTFVLRSLAVSFVGGSRYAGLADYIWMFAVEGTLFALLQMVAYRQIARQARAAVWWLWAAIVAISAVALLTQDRMHPTHLVALVVLITGLALAPVALTRPSARGHK